MPWFFRKKAPEPPKAAPPRAPSPAVAPVPPRPRPAPSRAPDPAPGPPPPRGPEPASRPPPPRHPPGRPVPTPREEPDTLEPVEWTPKGSETQVVEIVQPIEESPAPSPEPSRGAQPPPPEPPPPEGARTEVAMEAVEPPTPSPEPGQGAPGLPAAILLAEPARPAGTREDVALLLAREGLLTQEQIERAAGEHPPAWSKDLLDAGSVRRRALVDLLAGVYRLPRVRLSESGVDPSALDELPAAAVPRLRLLPFGRLGSILCVAAPAFPSRAALDEAGMILGQRPFKVFLCDPAEFDQVISEHLPGALARDRERVLDAWPAADGIGPRTPMPEEPAPEPEEDGPLTPLPIDER